MKDILTCYPLQCCPFEDVVSAETTEEPYLFATIHGGVFCDLYFSDVFSFFGSCPRKLAACQAPTR